MLRAPSKNNMSNIRDLFARDHKEKVPPDLRRALNLLKLNGFEDLEERFLSTDAFLRPWSVFRDSIFLLFPDGMPRSTQIIPVEMESFELGISRLDILWFYTQFDEGTLRYDPRADKYSADYTPVTRAYGMIDKSKWRVEEYEKHLFTWLLQEFKVGKGYSPWRFEWFELRNICTVWEKVLVPIVNAVRASYHPLGRRHYGRLALFIEARSPSQLAFPDSNATVPEAPFSPTPYRIVSVPKKLADEGAARGVLSKKHYDVTEKELRDVYPQYGGLVERPKFKHKMEEWLAEQRLRADRRKGYETQGIVTSAQPRIVQPSGSHSPPNQLPKSPRGSFRSGSVSHSPIKRYAEGIKRSLSNTVSSIRNREEKKSPLHGVTRQLHFPNHSRNGSLESWNETGTARANGPFNDSTVTSSLPLRHLYHDSTRGSVYSSIRSSNPLAEDNFGGQVAPRAHAYFSGTRAPSRLSSDSEGVDTHLAKSALIQQPTIHEKKSSYELRLPSYEGTEYHKEISLTDLHTQRMNSVRSPEIKRTRTPATRLPAPVIPVPYCGPRTALADTPSKSITAWPGADSDDDESLPPQNLAKLPEHSVRNPRSRQAAQEDNEHEVYRIVSRENIRGALGNLSRESSMESIVQPKSLDGPAPETSPVKQQLQTYNTHLFPRKDQRKGTPVGEWVGRGV
ncbi:hypothetical protein DE146DRAFT_721670 [Phaeosphaeria sp. MPI-PUGE-AT-0046c]|nr:hypothetical protein DE146DRAFT_721670 [Phaeosphaeria sp. MPI-PUGE-AT-0046c]